MKSGSKIVDRAVRKLLSEGFNLMNVNQGNLRNRSLLLTNPESREAAVIKYGEKKRAILERGPVAASEPRIIMPVFSYLRHWKP